MSEADVQPQPSTFSSEPTKDPPTKDPITSTPLEPADPTGTTDSTSSSDLKSLKDTVTAQGKVLESLPDLIKGAVSGVLEGSRPPPAAPAAPVAPPPLETPELDNLGVRADVETVVTQMFNERMRPLVPHLQRQAERGFTIEYALAKRDSKPLAEGKPTVFERLEPEIKKYFADHPEQREQPGAVESVLTHFRGVHSDELIAEAIEAERAATVVPPAGGITTPTPPAKVKRTTLTEDERYEAQRFGLSDEDMLASINTLVELERI